MYIKVLIMVRSYQEKSIYVVNSIKRIEDYNEVTNHFLSIFLNSEIRKKGYLIEEDQKV